jgi:hypothetical protein
MWEVKYTQDTEILGVGTVTATNGQTTYSRRVDVRTNADPIAFVNEAKALDTNISQRQTKITEIETAMALRLNT